MRIGKRADIKFTRFGPSDMKALEKFHRMFLELGPYTSEPGRLYTLLHYSLKNNRFRYSRPRTAVSGNIRKIGGWYLVTFGGYRTVLKLILIGNARKTKVGLTCYSERKEDGKKVGALIKKCLVKPDILINQMHF